MKACLALVPVLFVGALVTASSPVPSGLLEGRLKIATAKATQLDDADSTKPAPAPYAEFPLMVLSSDGKTQVAQVKADDEGRYRISLPPGDYILHAKKHGRLRSTARRFTIAAGKTVQVDFEIQGPLNVMPTR